MGRAKAKRRYAIAGIRKSQPAICCRLQPDTPADTLLGERRASAPGPSGRRLNIDSRPLPTLGIAQWETCQARAFPQVDGDTVERRIRCDPPLRHNALARPTIQP